MFDEQKFMQDRGLVNEEYVSEHFGVCRRTLARKRKRGLRHYIFKRKIYYRLSEVEEFMTKEIEEINNESSRVSEINNGNGSQAVQRGD